MCATEQSQKPAGPTCPSTFKLGRCDHSTSDLLKAVMQHKAVVVSLYFEPLHWKNKSLLFKVCQRLIIIFSLCDKTI